ncbi:MAG: ornithine cyclodeaminase family protein, partial [Marmoricola sp.]
MLKVSPQVAPQDCLVLTSGEVTEALAYADLRAALEQTLLSAPADEDRRFRQLLAVDAGAFHVVGGTAVIGDAELLGLKVNGRFDSGRMRGSLLLVDATTGAPTGLMDSGELTVARTAAMVAIAVSHFAPAGDVSALVVGTGRLAHPVIRALLSTGVERIQVWGRHLDRAHDVVAEFGPHVRVTEELAVAAGQAQVVVTITSAEEAIIGRDQIAPGALVVAVGSDAPTKQELDAELLADAAVIVDSVQQCLVQGELRAAVASRALSADDI